MADSILNVVLNKGLDTETPAFLQEPGSLNDCLNYEFTGADGVRRIDGYERYSGGPNGEIVDYARINVTVTDAAIVPLLVPNAALYRYFTGGTSIIGTVIAYSPGILTYLPLEKTVSSVEIGNTIDVSSSGPGRLTATTAAIPGVIADSAATFLANVRSYSATLRATVVAQAGRVAGVYWLRKSVIAAIDAPYITLSSGSAANVRVGRGLTNNGILYRVASIDSAGSNRNVYLEPTGLTTALTGINVTDNGTTVVTVINAASLTLVTGASNRAYLVHIGNPDIKHYSGSTTVIPASTFATFTGGTQAGGFDPKVGDLVSTGGFWWIIKSINLTSGAWSSSNAVGIMEFTPDTSSGAGFWPGLKTGDVINRNGSTAHLTVGTVYVSELAGTAALRSAQSKYTWNTFNFNGAEKQLEAYGANGVTRSFWVQTAGSYGYVIGAPTGASLISTPHAWGNIRAIETDSLDTPSFVSIHAGVRLALGYKRGSTLVSVVGNPYDFSGLRGAAEFATGDELTGLLDAQKDSTIMFGRRSIRRLVGNTSSTFQQLTISGSTGALPYTAVLVGATPVFTGVQGITSLEQAEEYGDFAGNRVSKAITNFLRPRLLAHKSSTELGGVIMAIPVRNKDQYRLWLSNGDVIVVTFSMDTVRISRSRYSVATDVRVPVAACSEIGDEGKERMFVVWDLEHSKSYPVVEGTTASTLPDANMIYELDKGWGFDGKTFRNYFELAQIFPAGSVTNCGIEKVRMFGKGYGVASLQVKTAGVEDDFDQAYHSTVQDISMPPTLELFSQGMRPVTSIIDQANWGLGIKVRIEGAAAELQTSTEPSHVCQVLVLHTRKGAQDG